MCLRTVIILLSALLVLPYSGLAEDRPAAQPTAAELKQKTLFLNTAVVGGLLVWGVANWDYFRTSPRARNEDWFGQRTERGGADKIGHIYITYITSRAFRSIYLDWGYAEKQASRLGTLSSLGIMTLMEVGDSFSGEFGFSYEDLLMNFAGAGFSYLMDSNPGLDRKLDLRVEYRPEFDSDFKYDFFTDYEHLKYLLAIKADGFDAITSPWLKYLELHLGYYTRNYANAHPGDLDRRERTAYIGLGLNVGKLLKPWVKIPVFDYLQPPYTYLPLENRLD